jgi:aminoglycoside/choline kinase family phosphotransferase
MVILADLGDQRLYDLTAEAHASGDWNTAMTSYTQVVEELAHMQIQAAQGLDPTWCWDTPNYDLDLMLQRESGYFLQALCTDLLGLSWDRKAVDRERLAIAQGAAQADSGFFLHRDFQSRNIMIFQNRPWFIDFQGGRLGPLGYDLASLLIDPYAALPVEMQHRLMARYLTILARLIPVEETAFRSQYHFLSLQRGMQIAGAFANLGYLQGKEFFLPYLRPTLDFLMHTLDPAFPALTKLCHQAQLALEQQHLQGSPTSRRGRDT